jgi:hypothetical protein
MYRGLGQTTVIGPDGTPLAITTPALPTDTLDAASYLAGTADSAAPAGTTNISSSMIFAAVAVVLAVVVLSGGHR